MSRTIPSAFVALAPSVFAPGRPILGSGSLGEATLVANQNFVWATCRAPIVATVFNQPHDVVAGYRPWALGSSGGSVRGLWCVPVLPHPWTHWEIVALVSNTSTTDAATLRVQRQSDGVYVDIAVAASSAAWTRVTGTLAVDASLTLETLELRPTNGASGELRVHSVEIRHAALTSIPAGVSTLDDGTRWSPIDDDEVGFDYPLSVSLRRRLHENAEYIRRTRIESIVGWSDHALARTLSYRVSGAYQSVLRLLFMATTLRRRIRWAAFGYCTSGTGTLRLSTGYSRAQGYADVEATLPTGWSSPFHDNLVTWETDGAVRCGANAIDELTVELTGTNATLMGLTAWLVDE